MTAAILAAAPPPREQVRIRIQHPLGGERLETELVVFVTPDTASDEYRGTHTIAVNTGVACLHIRPSKDDLRRLIAALQEAVDTPVPDPLAQQAAERRFAFEGAES